MTYILVNLGLERLASNLALEQCSLEISIAIASCRRELRLFGKGAVGRRGQCSA